MGGCKPLQEMLEATEPRRCAPARKDMPYDLEKFTTCASALLADQLVNVVDIHYRHLEASPKQDTGVHQLGITWQLQWGNVMKKAG